MKTQLLSKLVSLRLWGGLYLLCYGLLLEVAYSAARYELPFQWAYHLALLGFSASLSWKLSNLIKPVVKFVWPVMFIVAQARLPWGSSICLGFCQLSMAMSDLDGRNT